jgi:hypothetical protein
MWISGFSRRPSRRLDRSIDREEEGGSMTRWGRSFFHSHHRFSAVGDPYQLSNKSFSRCSRVPAKLQLDFMANLQASILTNFTKIQFKIQRFFIWPMIWAHFWGDRAVASCNCLHPPPPPPPSLLNHHHLLLNMTEVSRSSHISF